MASTQNKMGAIVALAGSAVAVLAFFAMPLFNLVFFQVTAVQLASNANLMGSSSSTNSGFWYWLALVLAILSALCALTMLLDRGIQPSPDPLAVHNRQNSTPALGIMATSGLALILSLLFYINLASQHSFGISGTSFLSYGFWVYVFALIVAFIGGFVQNRA